MRTSNINSRAPACAATHNPGMGRQAINAAATGIDPGPVWSKPVGMPANKSHFGGLLNGKNRLSGSASPAGRGRALLAMLSGLVVVFGLCLPVAQGGQPRRAEASGLKSEGLAPGTAAGRANVEWNPRCDVPGCILWLDASDVDGRGDAGAVSSPAAVALWADKSGHNHHAVQPTPAHQPVRSRSALGGRSILRFAGGQYLTNPLSLNWSEAGWELLVVAAVDGNAADQWRGIIGNRFGAGKAHWWTLGTRDTGDLYLELGAGHGPSPPFKARDFGRQIYHVSKAGAQFTLCRNGVSSDTATQPNVGGVTNELRIGCWFSQGQEWRGKIAEILFYQRTLPQAARDALEAYLARKWNVTLWKQLYARRATWLETQLATREAYWRQASGNGQAAENIGEDLWVFLERDLMRVTCRMGGSCSPPPQAWTRILRPCRS